MISFGAGAPDFPPPDGIFDDLIVRDAKSIHSYSDSAGLPVLRRAIAAAAGRDYGWVGDSSTVFVSNGAKQALSVL